MRRDVWGLDLVKLIQFLQIGFDPLLQLLQIFLHLGLGEVALTAVDRLELAAVNGDQLSAEQIQLPAQQAEGFEHFLERLAVVFTKVSDGLMVRSQFAQQPHHLDIALALLLQLTTAADAVQVAVDIQFQQVARRIGRATRLGQGGMGETSGGQIQAVHEGINEPHRVIGSDVLVQTLGKKHQL